MDGMVGAACNHASPIAEARDISWLVSNGIVGHNHCHRRGRERQLEAPSKQVSVAVDAPPAIICGRRERAARDANASTPTRLPSGRSAWPAKTAPAQSEHLAKSQRAELQILQPIEEINASRILLPTATSPAVADSAVSGAAALQPIANGRRERASREINASVMIRAPTATSPAVADSAVSGAAALQPIANGRRERASREIGASVMARGPISTRTPSQRHRADLAGMQILKDMESADGAD